MGKFDFSGWATRANIKCSDGRTILPDAFKHMDGKKVPLVWNHQHSDPDEVLGQALLEHRDEGVYAYCTFNETHKGKTAKLLVEHGDVDQLSIYANQLKQQGPFVMHGNIRELSLVLAGANPGAFIENVVIAHGDEVYEHDDEARIFTGEYISLSHSDDEDEEDEEEVKTEAADEDDDKDETDEKLNKEKEDKKGEEEVAEQKKEDVKSEEVKDEEVKDEKIEHSDESGETLADVFNTLNEKQKTVVYAMIGQALEEAGGSASDVKHSDSEAASEGNGSEETVADVFNTLNEKQKTVVYAMIGQALEEAGKKDEESEGGNTTMKHNVFDQDERMEENVLSHSEMVTIMEEAKAGKTSLRDVCLAHGIEDLDIMFPDNKALSNEPEFIKRNDDWVAKVLGGVHHTPFSRIKTIFADITANEARAKGYQKGNLKIEEVFKLLKRVTNPTTVYKKQKLDRDDVLDITDFDILPWLKKELRMMLNEEMARAFLIGDGRDPVDEADDKINEECIRPIWKMEELFTVKVPVPVTAATTGSERAKAFITAAVKSRKNYKGSGNPDMFMSEDLLTECLLLEDVNGRVIYDTEEKLRARLRVREIVPVPVMEGDAIKRTDEDGNNFELAGIYVNLKDYNVGTDKGGEVNFFDDFDIDYNQMKYLMETRCSGTLVKPYSAVAIEFKTEEAQG